MTRTSMKQQRTDRFKKSCIKEARQVAELGNKKKDDKTGGGFQAKYVDKEKGLKHKHVFQLRERNRPESGGEGRQWGDVV